MSLKSILLAGSAFASLIAVAAPANAAPYYRCGDSWCYDDQYEETRELNLRQLDDPGAGVYAVPGYDGPGYDDRDDGDDYGDRRDRWSGRYGDDDDYDDGYRDRRDRRGWDDRNDDDDDYGSGGYGDDDDYGNDDD